MEQRLRLGFEERAFAQALTQEIRNAGATPVAATERFVSDQFAMCMRTAMGDRLIKPPLVRISTSTRGRYNTLADLTRSGYETWYTEIWFSTKPSDTVTAMPVDPFGITFETLNYGHGIARAHQLKIRPLKRQVNHELRLNHVRVPEALFGLVISTLEAGGLLPQPYIANPEPNAGAQGYDPSIKGFRVIAFDHVVDGSRVFCSCAKTTHDMMRRSAARVSNQYVAGSWPHQVARTLAQPSYREGICHLCVARAAGPETAARCHGGISEKAEEAYIDQLVIGSDLDVRTARAEVQQRLGLSRWRSEAELFRLVRELFPDTTVQREASPPWLGRQRLDVFLPELRLALEYQGAQHFEAVALFGGDEGLRRAAERDTEKKRLCDQNGVMLVYVLHTDPLTPAFLKHRLRRFTR